MVAISGGRWGARAAISTVLAVIAMLASDSVATAVDLVFLALITPALAFDDLRERRLPNRLVYPALAIGALALVVEWANTGAFPVVPVAAAVVVGCFLLVLCAIGGMGMGDVKLAVALGLASWAPAMATLSPVIAFLMGGVASVVLLARRGRGGTIAFGPFLLAGFWIAAVLEAWARLGAAAA